MPGTKVVFHFFFKELESIESNQLLLSEIPKFIRDTLNRDLLACKSMLNKDGTTNTDKLEAAQCHVKQAKSDFDMNNMDGFLNATKRVVELAVSPNKRGDLNSVETLTHQTLYCFVNTFHQDRLGFEPTEHFIWGLSNDLKETYGGDVDQWFGIINAASIPSLKYSLTIPKENCLRFKRKFIFNEAAIQKIAQGLELTEIELTPKQCKKIFRELKDTKVVMAWEYDSSKNDPLRFHCYYKNPSNYEILKHVDLSFYGQRECQTQSPKGYSTRKMRSTRSTRISLGTNLFETVFPDFQKLCNLAVQKYVQHTQISNNSTVADDVTRKHTGLGRERAKSFEAQLSGVENLYVLCYQLGEYFRGGIKLEQPNPLRFIKNAMTKPGYDHSSFIAFLLDELKHYPGVTNALLSAASVQKFLPEHFVYTQAKNGANDELKEIRKEWIELFKTFDKKFLLKNGIQPASAPASPTKQTAAILQH